MNCAENDRTLDSIVDEYLAQRNISNKKYYAGYLLAAKWAWRELFQKTIYSVQSQWQPLRKGDPYNYIEVPKGLQRLFSVSVTDKCNNIVPLIYNNEVNVIEKPKVNTCSCGGCHCEGGLCEDVNNLTKLTKILFTINGRDYIETTWLKLCPNGDIIEYRNVPIKKYNNMTGDAGDYNNDYNNDYLIANPPFSDYEVIYQDFQKVICKLEVRPCGCPENTVDNEDLFALHCGAYCPLYVGCGLRRKACEIKGAINDKNYCIGSIKMSECGNKIYYIPKKFLNDTTTPELPEYLLVNYQVTGEDCENTVIVPEYAIETMFYGIHFKSTRFNMSLSRFDKQDIKYQWTAAQNELILYLSNFSFDTLSTIQDAKIRY